MIRWPWWLRLAIAVPLIIIGILGLILPIMPGWPFLIPGLIILLGRTNRLGRWLLLKVHRVRRWLKRMRKRT